MKLIIKLIIFILVLGLVFLAGRKSAQFSSYNQARNAYVGDKTEFDKNFEAMSKWLDDYKKSHPGATDAEASEAYQKTIEYVQKLQEQAKSAGQ